MLEFITGALLTGLGLLRLTFRHKWKYEYEKNRFLGLGLQSEGFDLN
jgi:hypothetical protein